jgi:hypothetical protein
MVVWVGEVISFELEIAWWEVDNGEWCISILQDVLASVVCALSSYSPVSMTKWIVVGMARVDTGMDSEG